jgi:hypothetical protein
MSAFLALFLVGAGSLQASATYTFTGEDFNSFDGNSNGLTTSDFVTGSLTFASPLGADFNSNSESFPTLLSWSLSDGVNSLSSANGNSLDIFQDFATDSNGQIDEWFFAAEESSGDGDPLILVSNESVIMNDGISGISVEDVSSDIAVGSAWYDGAAPGNWTQSAAPEPSTVLLLASGIAALVALRAKRARAF